MRNSRLVDLRQGQGVTPGVIRLSGGATGSISTFAPRPRSATCVDMISSVEIDGRPILAALTNDGIRVEYADGLSGTLAIADTEGSRLAEELSISNPSGRRSATVDRRPAIASSDSGDENRGLGRRRRARIFPRDSNCAGR